MNVLYEEVPTQMLDRKNNWLLWNVFSPMHSLKLEVKALKYLRMATFTESEITGAG